MIPYRANHLACLAGQVPQFDLRVNRFVQRDATEPYMTSRTILIVDDDDDLRKTLVEQLALYEEFDVLQEPTPARASTRRAMAWSTF
jgi:hypothetical protein